MKRPFPSALAMAALLAGVALAGGVSAQFPALAQTAAKTPASPQPVRIVTRIDDDDMVRYPVAKGDTLYVLAEAYMRRPTDWRAVQQLNKVRDPLRLVPGTSLRIPARLLKTLPLTASIIAFKGSGTIDTGSGAPAAIATGQAITQGMAIETGPGSFATVQLSNGSRLTLPSKTRLRVVTLRRFRLNDMIDASFLLEKGRIETRATPLGTSGGRYRIRTPIAVSAVRGTTFRAAYEGEGGASLTEVLEGSVAVAAETGKTDTHTIEAAFGASVSPQGGISSEALLPAPTLLNPGKVQVDPQVAFTLEPLPDAASYHVQIARDAGFVEMEQEAYTQQSDTRFDDIGNGRWFVRVSAIAPNGLEGMPRVYSMRRVLIGLGASSEQGEDGGYRFRWEASGTGRHVYQFRLRPEAAGAAPLVDETGLTGNSISISDLPPGTYRWSVGVQHFEGGENATSWLPEQSLTIAAEEGSPRARAR